MSQNPILPLPNHQDDPTLQNQIPATGTAIFKKSNLGAPYSLGSDVYQNHNLNSHTSNGPSSAISQNDSLQPGASVKPLPSVTHFLTNSTQLNNSSMNSSRNSSPIMNNPAAPSNQQHQNFSNSQANNSSNSLFSISAPPVMPVAPQTFPASYKPPQSLPNNSSPLNIPHSQPPVSILGYPSQTLPQRQINSNMPPLAPSNHPSHFLNQPMVQNVVQAQNSYTTSPPSNVPPIIPPSKPTSRPPLIQHSVNNAIFPPTSLAPSQVNNSMIPPPALPTSTASSQQRYVPASQFQFQQQTSQPLSKPQYPSPQQQYLQQNQPQNYQSTLQYPGPVQQYPQPGQNQTPLHAAQYNNQQSTEQQMGRLTVANSGFNQMWGHQAFDLLQCRHILPPEKVEPPEIKLGQLFAQSTNCSPDILRCTVTKMPESNNLLQKSRLPLGILIHPFRDLYNLPVIQCNAIVRCRSCRTYINPFVYFVDSKRWKCNLCYRVNDLPEDFQYDPVSRSYGDPTKRPEVKSATIEFIAPSEYMLRPPPPAVYLFLMDICHIARESGYLQVVCDTLLAQLEQLPGDSRKQVGFICYDSALHFYCLGEGLTRPREMTVLDIDDIFLPMPDSLLVNLGEQKSLVLDILKELPNRHRANPAAPQASALGAALQVAYKLMAPTGGRITVFQTSLPNIGPGALTSREDPNARSAKEVQHLNPATDFYKRLALDCSGSQIAVDLFLLNSQFADLSTLSGMSKFCGGTVHHIPLFKASRPSQAQQLKRLLYRYLTRKIGFEAVMRIRCTRGITIHTFHGNFFVRSTDLLALPNVSPDSGFGMQLTIEESLSDLKQVCFQAALLYTSSKGERRIRVHTMCLPVSNTLVDILNSADQQCIVGLLSKMAVDRSMSASLSDAREALTNVAVDALGAYKLASGASASPGLPAPKTLSLLPLYIHALLRHPAFRTGQSTRLDDRTAAMCAMKSLPLYQLMRSVYPDLYPIHCLQDYLPKPQQERAAEDAEDHWPDPPRLHLTAERVNSNGAYLFDDGGLMIIYIGSAVDQSYLKGAFGMNHYSEIPEDWRELPELETEHNQLLHAFVDKLNEDRPYPSEVLIVKDSSPNRTVFTGRLLDDRVESAFSYYEFLQHIKTQIK